VRLERRRARKYESAPDCLSVCGTFQHGPPFTTDYTTGDTFDCRLNWALIAASGDSPADGCAFSGPVSSKCQ